MHAWCHCCCVPFCLHSAQHDIAPNNSQLVTKRQKRKKGTKMQATHCLRAFCRDFDKFTHSIELVALQYETVWDLVFLFLFFTRSHALNLCWTVTTYYYNNNSIPRWRQQIFVFRLESWDCMQIQIDKNRWNKHKTQVKSKTAIFVFVISFSLSIFERHSKHCEYS